MASFLRNLISRLGPAKPPPARRVLLAAFGKHPGWDDHVEIGLESERLAEVRRILYVEGVGGNVESGAWERLEPNQRLSQFKHTFVWRRPDGGVQLGRLWSSRDGKGRSRYPMVVCADCTGLPLQWTVEQVLPVLADVEAACARTADAPVVSQVIAVGLKDLRNAVTLNGELRPAVSNAIGENAVSYLVGRPEIGADGKGLLAVLYQLVRDMAPDYQLDRPALVAEALRHHSVHLRVPACADSAADAALLWIRFLQTQLGPDAQVLTLQHESASWLDLIAGPPVAAQFFCLLATPAALPLTTDIPYQLDGAFLERANRFLEAQK
ncbi:MAG TPA: hypothetical protein VH475_03935 [Tepidisphaeraceae bacterium]